MPLILQKEKSRKRNASETQKHKSRKRMATETEKEKTRKRMATDANKNKCCERAANHRASMTGEEMCFDNETAYFKRISAFKAAVREGPYYICNVCNRCLYKKTVKAFNATLRGLIFAWTNFRECRPRKISRGFIFANEVILKILRGLIFANEG